MRALPGTVHINKIAAASRQLDAAIRMFFAKEDELAIHTVASAAFRVLRDLLKGRGRNLAAEIFRAGIYAVAQQYAEGKLPNEILNSIHNTPVMAAVKEIVEAERAEGKKFDLDQINVIMSKKSEQRHWPSKAASFLKHADRDAKEHLAVDEVKNENVLIGACVAFLELGLTPTPEVMAFWAFWVAENDADVEEGKVRELALRLRSIDPSARHSVCAAFIQACRRESSRA